MIEQFYTYEDYSSARKKAFYGFHWREYSAPELPLLFSRAGFVIQKSGTFVAFQNRMGVSMPHRISRGSNVMLASVFRRYGTHVYLAAEK